MDMNGLNMGTTVQISSSLSAYELSFFETALQDIENYIRTCISSLSESDLGFLQIFTMGSLGHKSLNLRFKILKMPAEKFTVKWMLALLCILLPKKYRLS